MFLPFYTRVRIIRINGEMEKRQKDF